MKITLNVPKNFNFWRTIYSHGWCALPPFEVDKDANCLKRVVELSTGKRLVIDVSQSSKDKLSIISSLNLTRRENNEVINQVETCLRLNEDYSEFYNEANKHRDFLWVSNTGAGRLLRAPTVFEDVIKMICTTNCSWALTEIMINNLCEKLGVKLNDSCFAFPTAEVIADVTEKYLRKEIRAGYRAPYLLELSKRIINGKLNIDSWRESTTSTVELFKEVRSIKGVGPYAAGNILKLLGRYDYLGIDSWCRKKYFEIHRNGRSTSDKVIEKHYSPFGKWKGLFFWMDVTKHWYEKKFPF